MNTAKNDCIWCTQCGLECRGRCGDFSPADESEENEAFYRGVLQENAQEYRRQLFGSGEALRAESI